jgi:hypothetical protein
MERLDPGLSVEEQSYVRRYLAYADTFLKNAKKELPSIKGGATRLRAEQRKNGKKAA